ncbi:EF-hand domain-containing protein D2 homolog [Symsagittifera roscoffensis]|uniref:EF-hand domain-containing protein D2 homolog n=1 Tax=Symsagittifera roscoffensis TaxID=84072 RepID=UPI00307C85EE
MGEPENELAAKLNRRQQLNDEEIAPEMVQVRRKGSLYTKNSDIPKKTIDDISKKFSEFDDDGNGLLDVFELTRLFEKLNAPQTRTAIKAMVAKVDKDGDGAVNLEEFVQLFREAASDQFDDDSIFKKFAALTEVDVDEVGVKGARDFFAAKSRTAQDNSLAAQIEMEREEAKRKEKEKQERREKMDQLRQRFDSKSEI